MTERDVWWWESGLRSARRRLDWLAGRAPNDRAAIAEVEEEERSWRDAVLLVHATQARRGRFNR